MVLPWLGYIKSWFCRNLYVSSFGFAITRIHTQKTKVAVLFKIDALYFHFCTLLFICIILAPIYNMNNNEKCSVCISLNEDCNALTFAILLVKLLFSLVVIQTVTVSPNQLPTAHLLMKIVFVIIMKSSITFWKSPTILQWFLETAL